MWLDFYKENVVYVMDVDGMLHPRMTTDQLIKEGFEPCFDTRNFSYDNLMNSGNIIIENDITTTPRMIWFQNHLERYKGGRNKHIHSPSKIVTSFHPSHIPDILESIQQKHVKNILIDSLFKDREQFRYVVNNLFTKCTRLNIFVISYGQLIDVLKDELENHADKYFCKLPCHSDNDLIWVLDQHNIYEVDCVGTDEVKYITPILNERKAEVRYGVKYKLISEEYKRDWSHIIDEEKPSVWK